VVLLAAGLDTRAYRLSWSRGVHAYELDLPEVLGFKETVLTKCAAVPRCDRKVVPVDLRKDWTVPLTKAGLGTDEPTAWLAEGLFTYLTARESTDLLTRVGELSASRSLLGFEVENLGTSPMPQTVEGQRTRRMERREPLRCMEVNAQSDRTSLQH
jgi:methyltransferase (TIGR00027 family)